MKLVRKTLLGLTALAVVIGLASCKMGAGDGDTDGNKWDLTMTIDTTDPNNPMEEGKTFRRFWEQISASEKVAGIKTTITIDPSKCTYVAGKAFVTGLIFDLNEGTAEKTVDFNLIGINPVMNNGKPAYYIERYEGVSSDKKKSGDTSEDAIGTAVAPLPTMSWVNCTTGMYSIDDAGIISIPVTITQENKTYKIKLGDVEITGKTYTSNRTEHLWTDSKTNTEYLVGGIACYGNAGVGNKIVANYKSDKDSVIGKLEAEEIEE